MKRQNGFFMQGAGNTRPPLQNTKVDKMGHEEGEIDLGLSWV